jgi:hypothetical protein
MGSELAVLVPEVRKAPTAIQRKEGMHEFGLGIYATGPQSKDVDADGYAERVADAARWREEACCHGIPVYINDGIVDSWLVTHQAQRAEPALRAGTCAEGSPARRMLDRGRRRSQLWLAPLARTRSRRQSRRMSGGTARTRRWPPERPWRIRRHLQGTIRR